MREETNEFTIYNLQFTIYDLRFTIYDLRFADLQFTIEIPIRLRKL